MFEHLIIIRVIHFVTGLLLLVAALPALANTYTDHDRAKVFIEEMATKHQFAREQLQDWFSNAQKKQTILDAISRPAEKTKTWAEYRRIFLNPRRIERGIKFWEQNQIVLERAEKEFGVPAEIIVAIIGVETSYGRNKGNFRVIDALSTLAFDYPPRSNFFYGELEEFLLLTREQNQNPLNIKGSYAGAMGYGQFIPSSYRAYAIDYNQDGFADIWDNLEDAVGSVANYFRRHGWRAEEMIAVRSRVDNNYDEKIVNQSLKPSVSVTDLKFGGFEPTIKIPGEEKVSVMKLQGDWGDEFWIGLHNFYVITRYNHSRLYAMAVWQLSQAILQARAS
ncbi:MAG: membrane-bound lytic murein transglycosylase B [Cellvibrionaceae bacterium]